MALMLAAAVLVLGFLLYGLMDRRLAKGDVFPEYSTFRSDAFGTKALYESLGLLPPLQVDRSTLPLPRLDSQPPMVLFKFGSPSFFGFLPEEQDELMRIASGGGRVVVALDPVIDFNFKAEAERQKEVREKVEQMAQEMRGDEDEDEEASDEDADHQNKDANPEATPKRTNTELRGLRNRATSADPLFSVPEWQVELEPYNWRNAVVHTRKDGAPLATSAPNRDWRPLPIHSLMVWKLPTDSEWETLFAIDGKPVVIRQQFGQGDVILMTDPYAFSNEALWTGLHEGLEDYRNADFLAWLIGDHRRVEFDEFGLGVADSEGVGTLARRYRLHAALAVLIILAGLFIWRSASSLIPASEQTSEARESITGHGANIGMQLLLQRAVPTRDLLPVCQERWRHSAGHGIPERVRDSIAQIIQKEQDQPARKRDLPKTYDRIVALLKERRKL